MKVILTQDVKNQGVKGQVIEVSDGYARNYLLPQGLAEEASKTKLKEIQEKNLREARKKDKEREDAEKLKAQLHGKTVEIKVKTGGNDKLFGAVTSKEIADSIQEKFNIKIDKKKVDITETIKHLGEYSIKIKIYPSVQAELNLVITAE